MATTTDTAEQVMNRTLKLIIVAGGESSIPGDMSDDFVYAMNKFVAELEANTWIDTTVTPNVTYGIDLGYTAVSAVSETLTIDDGMVRPLINALAGEMAPEYGVVLPPELAARARQGRRTLLRMAKTDKGTAFSSRLPRGSGNENDGTNYASTGNFYNAGEQ